MEYSSNGKGNLAVTLGGIGTGLGLLNGGLGNIFGSARPATSEDQCVNRFEMAQQAKISELETEVRLRDAGTYALNQVNGLRDYMERRLDRVEHELCDQKVYNATSNAAIGCIQSQIAQLQGLTKLVVPNSAICPTVAPATTTTPAA